MNNNQLPVRMTVTEIICIVASNPTPEVIRRGIEVAYALGQADFARDQINARGAQAVAEVVAA